MTGIENHDVVQALAANRSNQPFHIAVLPGACWCNKHFLNAQGLQTFGGQRCHKRDRGHGLDIRCLPVSTSLNYLLCDPFRRRVVGHIKMHDLAAAMSEHDKDVQHFERDRRYGKEVN